MDGGKGEHWALYGLNGAGKTALLNMLCAYYFPTTGKVTVLGREFGKTELNEKLRQKIGLVSAALQQKLYPEDSAFEIVLSGAFASIGLYESPSQSVRRKRSPSWRNSAPSVMRTGDMKRSLREKSKRC